MYYAEIVDIFIFKIIESISCIHILWQVSSKTNHETFINCLNCEVVLFQRLPNAENTVSVLLLSGLYSKVALILRLS